MQKDVLAAEFYSDDERYADLINGISFGGRQVVKTEDLHPLDTQTIMGRWNYRKGKRYLRKKARDLVRKTAFGINFAVIGVENQEVIDYALPLRNLCYDAGEYERQAAKIRKWVRKNKETLNPGEYLYGFQKESRLHPVITFILYYGEEEWDGAEDLHGIIDFTDIPEELRVLVQNFKVNVISVRKLADTSVFKTDIRQVFDFIRCSGNHEKLDELVKRDTAYQNMEEDAFDFVTAYTKSEKLIQVKEFNMEGGKVNMCKALDDMVRIGREEGINQGELDKTKTVIRNMLKRGMSDDDIKALAECSQELLDEVKRTGC